MIFILVCLNLYLDYRMFISNLLFVISCFFVFISSYLFSTSCSLKHKPFLFKGNGIKMLSMKMLLARTLIHTYDVSDTHGYLQC